MTQDEQDKVRGFRNAVDRFLTSASNPGRASAVVHDNTPGSPYHDLVMAKIEVDAMLWDRTIGGLPVRVLVDPKMPPGVVHFSSGPRPEQNVTVTGLTDSADEQR